MYSPFFSLARTAHVQKYSNGLFMFIAFGMLIECLIELLHLIIYFIIYCVRYRWAVCTHGACVVHLPVASMCPFYLRFNVNYFVFCILPYSPYAFVAIRSRKKLSTYIVSTFRPFGRCQRFVLFSHRFNCAGIYFHFFPLRHPLNTK